MTRRTWKVSAGAVALVACALAGATVAFGAGSTTSTTTTTNGTTTGGKAHTPESARAGRPDHDGQHGGNGETDLTGDTAAKAKAAAVAKEGGTADRATTENDSGTSAAAYEVHVTKSDGSRVVVILDKSFAVITVETHRQGSDGHDQHLR